MVFNKTGTLIMRMFYPGMDGTYVNRQVILY